MQNYSVKLVINQQRIKQSGLCALYLRILINREKIQIPLGLDWPLQFVDQINGKLLPRQKRDPDLGDYEMLINTEISKVNEVFKTFRLQQRNLSIESFKKEYKTFDKRNDFLAFMEKKIQHRYDVSDISEQTKKNHNSTVVRMKEFRPHLSFHDVDKEFLQKFSKWLSVVHANGENTVWGRIRDIITYLHLAEEEGIPTNKNYEYFVNSDGGSRIIYLEEDELGRMFELYYSNTLGETDQISLRAALFSCLTSLRISDVYRADWAWFIDETNIRFIPKKNLRSKIRKEVTIPLLPAAKRLIQNESGKFFTLPAEQTINISLKTIAKLCKIPKILSFHACRHTFGTLYYRRTKDLVGLQKLLGHTYIKDTMIYVHINSQYSLDGMKDFGEKLLGVTTGKTVKKELPGSLL